MIKTGFSSAVCPAWDLETIVSQASSMGYDGVELRGVRGALHLPLVPELAADPDGAAELFRSNNVELLCLGTSVTLDSKNRKEVAKQKGILTEFIELASRLGCPLVRLYSGEVQRFDNHRATLSRVSEALISLAPLASRYGVSLVVENCGDLAGSVDLWFLIDAADHPAVRCCWNQCNALTLGERPTLSIPRLGASIGLVHLCDADYDDHGVLLGYRTMGEGGAEVAKQIELLKGLAYDGHVVFDWPKLWVDSLPVPEQSLPAAIAYLRERIDEQQTVLSAYKGDKRAPNLASR